MSIFCTFMEGLYKYSLQAKATETHRFIKTLKEKNKLLRCYTQNIDSLEKTLNLNCGIDASIFSELTHNSQKSFRENWQNLDVVQLHGNLHKLACTYCMTNFEWTPETQSLLKEGENPECESCQVKYQERLYSGKRLTGSIGILRPNIVLYGEDHPQSEILAKGLNIDIGKKADLLLIMGTSLKVDGVKKLVRAVSKAVRARGGTVIFINKTPASKQWSLLIDYEVLCDCDDFVRMLKHEIPDLFLTQEQLDSKKLHSKSEMIKCENIKFEDLEFENDNFVNVKSEDVKCENLKSENFKVENLNSENVKFEHIKFEETIFTPPSTPSKKRTVLLPKRKKIKTERSTDLPSPSPSFSELVKSETEDDVSTDIDEDPALQSILLSTLNRKREGSMKWERINGDSELMSKKVKV